ncbi:two-component regulator propeller domain-containing protein [Mucilaginibacter sp. PAMB04274]|uniref:hybrid sensor histidine kinase/response regulator transcription factor n=1 Tax=Mucilaginibacter sp. PAMB04274 TaxID=3138568 RepID=UPI0031F67557
MRKFWCVILLLLACSAAYPQLSFDHLTVANGLSQSSVISICKDSRGYMWFGTRDRLNRYDARSIKTFNHDYKDPGSISCSDYVFSIIEDSKKNLWVGTVKGLNRYRPENNSFEHFLHNPAKKHSISDDNVYCIYNDRKGRIWIGTNNGLNLLANSASREFMHFFKAKIGQPGLSSNQVYAIYEDHAGNIWVGGSNGLTKISYAKGKYQYLVFPSTGNDPDSLHGNAVRTITEDRQHRLWFGTETGGLNLYNPETASFTHFKHDPLNQNSLSHNDVRKIILDKTGQLWVGTINGLNILNPETQTFVRYEHDAENRRSLSDNSIKDIYQDQNGSIWIGTTYGGVNVVHPDNIPFKVYQANKFKNSISGNIISAIIAGPKGNLWIGTEGYGLNQFNTVSGEFKHYKNQPANKQSLSTNFVKAVYRDSKDNLWVGLHQGGLELFQPAGENFKHFRHDPNNAASISSDIVSSLLEDSRGRFWVGTSNGLNILDLQSQRFRMYLSDPVKPFRLTKESVRCIYEDSKHNIWVGTTVGLNLLRPTSASFKWFMANERNPNSLKVGYINCIKEDSQGNVWVGSFHGGLSRYIPSKGSFITYGISQGLSSDNVLNIQQGDANTLWISTDNGLVSFDLRSYKFKSFTVKDGLPTNEFNYNSSFKDERGNLFLGTYNGLVSFNPREIKSNEIEPVVQLSGLKLFNEPVAIGDKTGLLHQDISLTKEITFNHNQNVFSIDFTSLNFDKPDRNQFMFKLDGFEKKWNYVSVPTATYTNLPAGEYDFLLRGSNNDGVWSKTIKKLHIRILPPFWLTWWAYLAYLIIFGVTLYLVIRFFRRQARLERDLYYEHLNYERQQEVHQLKLDFFTKISHEIRTPLSLILAPVESLLEAEKGNIVLRQHLQYVKQNANRLMRLVNELLDFRKAENGFLKLRVAEQDISAFCKDIFESFAGLAASRNITYLFEADEHPVALYFDASQLEKVLFNILSNAFKFTPDNGTILVALKTGSSSVEIHLTDNGPGISKEGQEHIFENFYQDKGAADASGWGIGLALAKNIVDLHKGEITVDSVQATEKHSGTTTFKVILARGLSHFSADQFAKSLNSLKIENEEILSPVSLPTLGHETELQVEKPVLLLVEDNQEVRDFLKVTLCRDYQIYESENGKEGWEAALKTIPDLVISDVAMPIMDGYALCGNIKADERTNHIPVILLTAKADQNNQLDGLKRGADVYITKPFSVNILQQHIRNLLSVRQAMRQKFSQQMLLMPTSRVIDSPDETFLNKLLRITESHLENPDFDVAMLVDKAGMSQTVLYRKIKALSGMSISDFIKSVRLKQAAALLVQNKLTIAEVAYAVGFNDRKYFSKEFKKQFGKSPSDYVTQVLTHEV